MRVYETASAMGVHGSAWECMRVHGSAWECMGVHGSAWECMNAHGSAWECTGVSLLRGFQESLPFYAPRIQGIAIVCSENDEFAFVCCKVIFLQAKQGFEEFRKISFHYLFSKHRIRETMLIVFGIVN